MSNGQCECGAALVLRTAKKGPNAGGQFWGCSAWRPGQAHTVRPFAGASAATATSSARPPATKTAPQRQTPAPNPDQQKVNWRDAIARPGWKVRYVGGSASLRCWPEQVLAAHRARPTTTWMAVQDLPSYEPAEENVQRVLGMMTKLLRRGSTAPVPASAENALLHQLDNAGEPRRDRVTRPPVQQPDPSRLTAALHQWQPDQLDAHLQLDSDEELLALRGLLAQVGGNGRRILPQAPLDQLARSWGQKAPGSRRLDFLYLDDAHQPVALEVDGEQHHSATEVDQERDQLLARLGVPVQRTTAAQVRAGTLPACATPRPAGPAEPLISGPAAMDGLLLTLTEGLSRGFLLGDTWTVELHDPSGLATVGLPAYLQLLTIIDELWAGDVTPHHVTIQQPGRQTASYQRRGTNWLPAPPDTRAADVRVVLELEHSPLHQLPAADALPTIVLRAATIPVPLLTPAREPRDRIPSRLGSNALADALRVIVQEIFDKPDFRDGQLEGIIEVLAGRDCVVLLPTGAGKSLIYQVAGMVLPGRTIVIDPLVALMEDQVRSLQSYGIDRVADISSQTTARGQLAATLDQVASGDALFVFIAPERLQQQNFRDAMRQLAQATPINLAVVDETHCVSEWGHDFRTAYLRLGSVLRKVCRDTAGQAPPVLALTGTASRAVLRDVLIELSIQPGPGTLVKPRSFDRKELSFEIIRTQPNEAQASFIGLLNSLPGRFGLPAEDFFAAAGPSTHSGLVFAPHTNGAYGVTSLADKATQSLNERVLPYSGGAPTGVDTGEWNRRKRANAAAFMDNTAPLLISTKAFGMGIDKPNVRYVIHMGIPGSIEAYYQEVGRAGRDQQPATCLLLFSEFNEQITRAKLDDDIDVEQVRTQGAGSTRQTADDIDRQLFFHLNSFTGVDVEIAVLHEVLLELGDLRRPKAIAVPMGTGDSRQRALHRLVLLGVIDDYLVDWGGRRFDIVLTGAASEQVIAALLRYIERAQPGQSVRYQDTIHAEAWDKVDDAIRGCARLLIAFIYDTVEKARRRALREMWLAAHESRDPIEFRARILDYLAEGDVAPLLERLTEERTFAYLHWTSALDEVLHVDDIREWRGSSGRLLGSYPDHPGLLLARSMSELLDPAGSLDEANAALVSSLQAARAKYGVDDATLGQLMTWAVQRCLRAVQIDAAVLVAAIGRQQLPAWRPPSALHGHQHPGAAILALESSLEQSLQYLEALTNGGYTP